MGKKYFISQAYNKSNNCIIKDIIDKIYNIRPNWVYINNIIKERNINEIYLLSKSIESLSNSDIMIFIDYSCFKYRECQIEYFIGQDYNLELYNFNTKENKLYRIRKLSDTNINSYTLIDNGRSYTDNINEKELDNIFKLYEIK